MLRKLSIFLGIFLILFSIIAFPLTSASPDLIDNIVSYYKMDDDAANTDVDDELDNNEGTATFNTVDNSVAGKIGTSLTFNGNNDKISIGTPFLGSSGEFTFTAWVKVAVDEEGTIIGYRHDGTLDWRWLLIPATGKLQAYLRTSSNINQIDSTSTIDDGAWHFVVWSYDGTTQKLYVDNILEDTQTPGSSPGNLPLTIGTQASQETWWMTGELDEIGIWPRALTDGGISISQSATGEIGDLWASGAGLTYPFVLDTCSCPGLASNWEIDHSDACVINDDCNLSTGKLSFTGIGTTKINATITTTNLGDPGSTGILEILINALIWVNG